MTAEGTVGAPTCLCTSDNKSRFSVVQTLWEFC
jgi:hypothetical protein